MNQSVIENSSKKVSCSDTDTPFNTEKMSILCDDIIRTLSVINKNKDLYINNKNEMLKIVKFDNPIFYDKYPRICRTLVFEDDISPLLGMIQTFAQVQEGKISYEKANNLITSEINAKYVDPVLNSEKLVKEREEKKKIIDISNK